MEDALVLCPKKYKTALTKVLILVLMEDALVPDAAGGILDEDDVLILVLMEDALVR